jgi:hypothetical protein
MHAQGTTSYTDPWFLNLFILEYTPEYFYTIATTPGGWTTFIVTLCIYTCHYPVFGALVIIAFALFLSLIFALYIKGCGIKKLYHLYYVPSLCILILCFWYELRYLEFFVPVAGALVFSILYKHFQPSVSVLNALWLSLIFWFTWYFVGWGCFLFLLFVMIQEFCFRKQNILFITLVVTINGALLFLLDHQIIPLNKTIQWRDFMVLSGLPLVMVLFFPIVAVILLLINRRSIISVKKDSVFKTVILTLVNVCCLAVVGIWLFKDPINHNTRTIARTVHNVMNRQWDDILHEKTTVLFEGFPKKADPLQLFMIHSVNQALCRTNQAGDRLFSFPQASLTYDPLLMLESTHTHGVVNWVVVLELVMDLGMINSAEKIAGEIMETMGPYPDIVYRRAIIQLAKGNNDAATIYLKKLLHIPFYTTKAMQILESLDNNNLNFLEPRIAMMNVNKDTIDYFLFNRVSPDALLRSLLQSNSQNKLAYNYLISYCLLTGQLEDVTILAQAATSFGYSSLPRYWEEAVCMNLAVQAQKTSSEVPFTGLREETVDRFYKFTQTWLQMENDPLAAEKSAPVFGDSYFYFSMFRHSRGVSHE